VVGKGVPDPKIAKTDDMIIQVTSTAICGSDLHLVHRFIPNMEEAYVFGHEPMEIVEEVGSWVTKLKKEERVIIPFNIACGACFFCNNQL
ncbi:alcohol dehydrogenase catalytic domain-containing protein, partial [Bacillus subtilis]